MEKLCEWYGDLHSFAMACALTHYCRTFTRQNLYLEFLTPPLYSSKSSWSAHLEFPGTKMVFFSPGLIASNVQSGHPQTLIGVGGKRIRRSSGIKLTNCKLAMKQKKITNYICFRHSLQSLSRSRRTLITKNKQEITPTHLAAWTLIQSNCPSGPIHDSCGT